ncbi:MAG: molybdopterin-dependent oxidoreductase [Eggerthellaceae bacterium]
MRYPQKRVGEKGSGQWKRITWEEAYEEARDRFTKIGEEHGWHTIAHQYGTGRDMLQFQAINKLWLELGSTATFGVGNLCWVGSRFSSQRLYGDETQYTGWDGNNTDCILIWCRQSAAAATTTGSPSSARRSAARRSSASTPLHLHGFQGRHLAAHSPRLRHGAGAGFHQRDRPL